MAWTTPKTWASGYVVLAADLNTHLRDNLNVTAPAVLTTAGDILYASGANTPARLAKSTTSTQYLANTGSSNAPAWNEVALDTGVSATLPVGNGGTGATSLTANGILVGNSTSAVAVTATMATKGHLMAGDGSGVPSMLAVGSNDTVLTADSGEATGVKWAAAAGGGSLTLIGTVEASDDATLTITGLASVQDGFMILITDFVPATDGAIIRLRFGDSGGVDTGTGDYAWHCQEALPGGSGYGTAGYDASDAQIQIGSAGVGNATGEGIGAVGWLTRPGDGDMLATVSGTYSAFMPNNNSVGGMWFGVMRLNVITLDRVEAAFDGGNVTSGRLSVYGVAHA